MGSDLGDGQGIEVVGKGHDNLVVELQETLRRNRLFGSGRSDEFHGFGGQLMPEFGTTIGCHGRVKVLG